MKIYLLILLTLTQLFSSASLEHVSINGYDFTVVKESYDIYDSKGTAMKIYREEPNKNLTFVLSLVLHDATGGCSGKSLEDGSYEINGSAITFYTQWSRRGNAHEAPVGARIQHFEVLSDGEIQQHYSELYIETARKTHADEGLKYLFTKPNSDDAREKLEEYFNRVEQKYKATFVLGKERDNLIKRVKEALKKKQKVQWDKI